MLAVKYKRKKIKPTMTRDEYQIVRVRLGLSYRAIAEHLGITERTALGYGADKPIPPPTGKLLRLWLQLKTDRRSALCPF